MDIKKFGESAKRFLRNHPFCLSFYEAVFTLFISNLFLLFLVFAHVVATPGTTLTWALAVQLVPQAFSSTEIFVYILALVAPALWIMVYNWRGRRNPIIFFGLSFVQVAIIVGSSYIYGQAKQGMKLNAAFVDNWAIICYVSGVLIWYITLVYDKYLNIAELVRPPESGKAILQELG